MKREPHEHKGILWIYGDSISKRLADFLKNGPYREICETIFKECKSTYTWIYNLENETVGLRKTDGKDYNHSKVMREITEVNDECKVHPPGSPMLSQDLQGLLTFLLFDPMRG